MAKTESEKNLEVKRSVGRLQRRVELLEKAVSAGPSAYWSTPSGQIAIRPPACSACAGSETTGDGFISFEGCDKFFENTTDATVTVTVTICNDDPDFPMDVDIDDKIITGIDVGKCKTIVVKIPAGKSLHANRNGRYRPES